MLLGGLAGNPSDARNVALLVAVGQFGDPQLKSQQLLGTAADIESVQKALSTRWGFAPEDVKSIRDAEATHARILAEIAALEQRSRTGDTVLIYFSGHGTSANADENSFDLPYATGAWVPYDLDVSTVETAKRSLIVGRRDLVPLLKKLDQGGRAVVVVSDSCYSGQVVRSFGQTASHSRYLPLVTRDLGVSAAPPPAAVPTARPPPPPYPYQHVVLLSGASDSETGADISSPQALQQAPTLDGKYHGAFTDAFLRLLDGQLVAGTFNYSQGREAMNTFLEHRNFAQHPQLLPAIAEDPQDVGSNPFLGMHGPASSPAAPPPPVPPPAAHELTVRLRLESVSPALRAKVEHLPGVTLVSDRDNDLTLRPHEGQVELVGPAGDPILRTTAADPNLIRRIAAQAWLNRVLPSPKGELGLRAETNPGSRGNTFVQCESFDFELHLRHSAYVMVLDLDPQGNLTVLYPTRASERQVVGAGTAKAIPGSDPKDQILVTPPFGTDQVAVVAFERAPGFFADLTGSQPFAADGDRAAALAKGLAGASGAIDIQQINVRTYAGKKQCGS
jgi:hypothetical protein